MVFSGIQKEQQKTPGLISFLQHRSPGRLLSLILLVLLLLAGCAHQPEKQTEPTGSGLTQTHAREKGELVLKLSGVELTVADQLQLVLEATVPEGGNVQFPSFSASIGDFTLVDTSVTSPRLIKTGSGSKLFYSVTYLLEPYLSGNYSIPSLKVSFTDPGSEGSAPFHIDTDAIEVRVRSILGDIRENPAIQDIKGPVSVPGNRLMHYSIMILLFLAAVGLCLFLYRRKQGKQNAERKELLAPHEIALRELDGLLAEDLLARGEVKLFHLRISSILRHYIENRFGLRAPEQTTEEFLSGLRSGGLGKRSVISTHKSLLADFLNQCDLVKFAGYRPSISDSDRTVAICRQFIEQTRDTEEQVNETSPSDKGRAAP